MLLGIFILFSINIFLVCFFSKLKKAILPILMYLSFLVLLSGFYLYYLKTGGLLSEYKTIILGSNVINQYFINCQIDYNFLANIINFGRLFFCLFFVLFAIQKNYNINIFFLHRFCLYYILIMIIVICFSFSTPKLLTLLFAGNYILQKLVVKIIDVIIYIFLFFGMFCHLLEYFDIHLNYIRNRQKLLIFSQLLLVIQFLFFSRLEPITIFQNYSIIRYNSSFSPFIGGKVENFWVIVLFFCLISTILNLAQNWRYYKVDYDRAKKELTINEKISSASASSSILIHGLKNQLLSLDILIKDLGMQIEQDYNGKISESVRATLDQLEENQQFIQKRLDILYNSFFKVNTKLVLTDSTSLRDITQEKLKSKINSPHIYWKVRSGTLLCDKNLLSEALSNIICNAVEACENVFDPIIMVKILFLNKKTIISVSDNGPGLPKNLQEKVFQPFITTKNSLTNWGLGLCYSKMIVEKHMGDISFISKENEGTTLIITLPKYKETKKNE